jgi:hypothetical protein
MIVSDAGDDLRAEAIVRSLAIASNDEAWVVDHPSRGEDLKRQT